MKWVLVLILSGYFAHGEVITFMDNAYPCTNYLGNTYCNPVASSNIVTISSNQIAEIIYNSFYFINVIRGTNSTVLHGINQVFPADNYPVLLSGPLTLEFWGQGMATYKLTPKEEPIQPGTGVVIPSDATGPVEIILESSADLVNWTASVPGTYGVNTTNRFFRVRAVRH